MQALTKNDMKPSRAPCFFSKSSLSRSRRAMTAVMSTSLKVVSMAAVFCASLRRLAMVRRSRVMRTRSSRSARDRGPAGAAGFAAGALAAGIDRKRCQHVGLGGAAVLAGGLDRRRGNARLLDQLAHGRARCRDIGGDGERARRQRRGRRGCGRRRRSRLRRGRRGSRRRGCGGRLSSSARSARLDMAKHAANLDGRRLRPRRARRCCRPPRR